MSEIVNTQDYVIKTTKPENDRTKASVVHYKDTGKKNIVMRGPLAEIIGKALNEYYKRDNETSAFAFSNENIETLQVRGNGRKLSVQLEDDQESIVFAVATGKVLTDDVLAFFKQILNRGSDELTLLLRGYVAGQEGNAVEKVLVALAERYKVPVETKLSEFFDRQLGLTESTEQTSEPVDVSNTQTQNTTDQPAQTDDLDFSSEALDNHKPRAKKTLRGKAAKIAKQFKGSSKQFTENANTALTEIEQLAARLKEQDKIYKAWAVQTALTLAQTDEKDYDRVQEKLLKTRPKSPAELVGEQQYNWPGLGSFKLAGETEKTEGEKVFLVPKVEAQEEESAEIEEPDEETKTMLGRLNERVSSALSSIGELLSSSEKDEQRIEETAPTIKEKVNRSGQGKRIRRATHPKVVEASGNTSFLRSVGSYLNAMGKYARAAIMAD